MNKAAINKCSRTSFSVNLSFHFLGKYLGVGLLCPMVSVCLRSKEVAKLFSTRLCQGAVLPSMPVNSSCSAFSLSLGIVSFVPILDFNYSIVVQCSAVAQLSFSLMINGVKHVICLFAIFIFIACW